MFGVLNIEQTTGNIKQTWWHKTHLMVFIAAMLMVVKVSIVISLTLPPTVTMQDKVSIFLYSTVIRFVTINVEYSLNSCNMFSYSVCLSYSDH